MHSKINRRYLVIVFTIAAIVCIAAYVMLRIQHMPTPITENNVDSLAYQSEFGN